MGVSVRLSRNVRAYLPFWLAIPVMMLAAAVVWAVVVLAAGLCWLVTAAWRAVRGRGAASRDARTSSGRN